MRPIRSPPTFIQLYFLHPFLPARTHIWTLRLLLHTCKHQITHTPTQILSSHLPIPSPTLSQALPLSLKEKHAPHNKIVASTVNIMKVCACSRHFAITDTFAETGVFYVSFDLKLSGTSPPLEANNEMAAGNFTACVTSSAQWNLSLCGVIFIRWPLLFRIWNGMTDILEISQINAWQFLRSPHLTL